MSEETKYDKRAKNIRYRFDKEGFKKARWEQLERKEKDFWRGSVQQWDQDRSIEMANNVSRRIQECSDDITLKYRTSEGQVLAGTDLDGSRTVLYVVLQKLIKEFEPRNEKYEKTEKDLKEFFGVSYKRKKKEKELG